MKILKILGYILLITVAGCALLVVFAAPFYRDVPASVLEARLAGSASRFIDVGGVRVHYRDEGQGPVVVLIHANYANLMMWEPWAAKLKDRYRVVRFDLTAHGLTGPDPTRDYSLERSVATLEGLLARLGISGPITLGGTSVGGTVAMHYTVLHPDRVQRLILVSPGSLEKDVRGRTTPREVPRFADLLTIVTPRWMAAGLLSSSFGDKSRVTDAMIDEWYQPWMREGNRQAMLDRLRQYVSGDVEGKIRAVSVPVLLLWGDRNPRVPVALAYEFQKLLVHSPAVRLEILKGVGHMAVHEAPDETAQLVRDYLDHGG